MEVRLLKSVLSKDVYRSIADTFTPMSFTDELEDIAISIIKLHDDFVGDLDIDILKEYIFTKKVISTAKKDLIREVLNQLDTADPVDIDVCKKFIFNLARKSQRLDALNKLAQIIEKNEDSHESVIEILEGLHGEEREDSEIVGSLLSDLSRSFDSSIKFGCGISAIQNHLEGFSRGNLVIVFGRPEVGKSSYTAFEVGNWLKNGHSIDYYANEEPGRKIVLNIRRAVTGETDADIKEAITKNKDNTVWPTVHENLKVREIGDIDIETIISRAKKSKPDIIVLDQLDKMTVNGKYNNTADKLKALYERARVLAKTADCLVVAVSQASADAENKHIIKYNDLENSKTGKAGEADVIIGIGSKGELSAERSQLRTLTLSKNKINGWLGSESALFDRHANQWSSAR